MPEDNAATIDYDKIVALVMEKIDSQIEKKLADQKKVIKGALEIVNAFETKLEKFAELGAQQSTQLSTMVNTINEIGKKVTDGPKRISTAAIDETGKGFETLMD